jgi:cation diffusion facilitator CzcD-associated flavoprotein CzcO
MHMAPVNGRTKSPDEGTINGNTMDICIIGGGAAGLSALQVIMGTPQYRSGHWKPTLFEARDKVGGVWYAHHLCAPPSVETDHPTNVGSPPLRTPRIHRSHHFMTR